jgi:hypothetical protein
MSEWGRAGGPLPHNPDLQREHQREMRDAIEHDRLGEAEQLRSRPPKRPWWKFWVRRSR